jgi:hypothetical protein
MNNNELEEKINIYLDLKHRINSYLKIQQKFDSPIDESKVSEWNEEYSLVKTFLKNYPVDEPRREKIIDDLFSNLTNFKSSIENLKNQNNASSGLSISQGLGNGGELFKKLSRQLRSTIYLRSGSVIGFEDLKSTTVSMDKVEYDHFLTFLNSEITQLAGYEFDGIYSFMQYYNDFEQRVLKSFDL